MSTAIGLALVRAAFLVAISTTLWSTGAAAEMARVARHKAVTDVGARSHHAHRIGHRPADQLRYYGRPVLYAPAPLGPFPPFFVYGWKPW